MWNIKGGFIYNTRLFTAYIVQTLLDWDIGGGASST